MWKARRTRIAAEVALLALATVTTALVSVTPASATRTYLRIHYGIQYPELGITYWASESADNVTVDIPAANNARIVFHDPNASSMTITDDLPGTPCTLDNATTISCPKFASDDNSDLRKVFNVSVIGWGGNDDLGSSGTGKVYGSTYTPLGVTLSGWENDDVLTANGGYSFLVGGDGNDVISTSSTSSPDIYSLYCRGGTDSVVKSTGDVAYNATNCETVSTS